MKNPNTIEAPSNPEPESWPGDDLKKPGTETEKPPGRDEETTIIPLVR